MCKNIVSKLVLKPSITFFSFKFNTLELKNNCIIFYYYFSSAIFSNEWCGSTISEYHVPGCFTQSLCVSLARECIFCHSTTSLKLLNFSCTTWPRCWFLTQRAVCATGEIASSPILRRLSFFLYTATSSARQTCARAALFARVGEIKSRRWSFLPRVLIQRLSIKVHMCRAGGRTKNH